MVFVFHATNIWLKDKIGAIIPIAIGTKIGVILKLKLLFYPQCKQGKIILNRVERVKFT